MPPRAGVMLASLLLVLLLAAVPGAHAQGTIADSPATFTRPVSSFDAGPLAHFTGVSAPPTQDHLFEMGWWYRIAGDTREKFLPAPNAQSYVGASSTITWNDVDGRGFAANETNLVTNGGGPSGQVTFSLTITNGSSTTPLDIDVFHVIDVDLGGTSGTDSAELLMPNERIRLVDGANVAEYGAIGSDAFLVLPYDGSGVTDVAGVLSNTVVDDFDNSGLPFAPGDLSAGFQWTTTAIPPSGSATFVAGIAVDMPLTLPAGPTTTSTSTSSTTITLGTDPTTTTSTTLPAERCDNCADDDGDGLVDFEDGDCCIVQTGMPLRNGSLRARDGGRATVKLKATLRQSELPGGPAPTEDVTIQLQSSTLHFCARIPAASFSRRRRAITFRDPGRSLASAQGLDAVTLTTRRTGSTKLTVRGKEALLVVPGAGLLGVTLGLRNPATAETGNRCAGSGAGFRATKNGLRYP